MEDNEEAERTASAEALDAPPPETLGAQAEQACATLTPDPRHKCGFVCRPWCLVLALILLLLSLFGSWAVVHLTLGTHGGSPFRLSASYDQRIPQDDTATIEPHFTTNCTMGKLTHVVSVRNDCKDCFVWVSFCRKVGKWNVLKLFAEVKQVYELFIHRCVQILFDYTCCLGLYSSYIYKLTFINEQSFSQLD